MTTRKIALGAIVSFAVVATVLVVASIGSASLSPSTATFTLRPGTGATETKTVNIPATPPSADVEIAIDTTGSMAGGIADAKSEANAIVTGVQASVANTAFAAVQFKDSGDSPEYQVLQSMTLNASDISTALSPLSASGGGDAPEAHNLVFHNSYVPSSDGPLGWRSGTRKFVIVISDAQPHGDLASQGFAGCANVSADPHGFVTSTELAGMAAAQRTLLMIHETDPGDSTNLTCYQSLAAAGFSGGAAVNSGGSGLAGQIVSLINAAFANVNNVHLEVVSAGPAPAAPSWITLPPAIGPVPAPSTQTFGPLGINVPPGTPAGTYNFDIRAVADGIDIGHQALTVIVPPKQMTLTPATDTNDVGTSHTVTAHVFDATGPFVGDTVNFTVSGGPAAVPSSGTGTTNASGNATFTFSNTPPNPGTNTITATDGDLNARATKEWVDRTPPKASCTETTNPAGGTVPPAGATTLPGPKGGQNEDGFYQMLFSDNVAVASAVIQDSASSFSTPVANGEKDKITQSPGGTPNTKPMAGVITQHITLKGDALLVVTDTSGNVTTVSCKVPPPPK